MHAPFKSLLAATSLWAFACTSTTDNDIIFDTPLQAPSSLGSVSLDQAVALDWSDNAFQSDPSRFLYYRVYSATYDLDAGLCGTRWDVEGTTVAPEFVVGDLTNGVPRCYAVTALSTDDTESDRSPLRQDTPRPDARNVLIYAFGTRPDSSGFRFWDDFDGDGIGQDDELGLVDPGTATDIDLVIRRNNADSSLWIVPVYSGTTMRPYGWVADLTSIDFAPASGYTRDSLPAQVGYGYVVSMNDGELHYGAFRVTHVGRRYLILDWSVQTDRGNPELVVRGGKPTAKATGSGVAPAR